MRQFTSTICGAGCSLLLLALPAHALPEFQNAAAQPEIPRAHPPVSTADMTLFELIAGGIAEHRKQPEFAFEAFFDAAKKTRSAQVAAMAWRAAITARNPEGVVRAAKLWIDIDKSAELLISGLVKYGLEALEVSYPSHNETEEKTLRALASKYRLIPTAGSDFHYESSDGYNASFVPKMEEADVLKLLHGNKTK